MKAPTLARRHAMLWPIALPLLGAAVLFSPPAGSADSPTGALFAMTNQPHNQIVVFARGANGSISEVQRVVTGGAGALNNPPFPQDHLDADNEIELTADGKLLFAVNAGDDTVSSFHVGSGGRLTLVDREPSGGHHPVSLDSYNGLLYVVNELDQAGNDVSGLRYTKAGKMKPIPGSTRSLATPFMPDNGFGFAAPLADQVIFSPDGRELSVPERM